MLSAVLVRFRELRNSGPGPVTLWRRLLESAESGQIGACPPIRGWLV